MVRGPAEVLIFVVAGRQLGLPVAAVREILPALALTPVSNEPAWEGVFNLRGRIVPVVDLRKRLGLPAKELTPEDHLLVIQDEDRLAALRVDRVLELRHMETAELEEVPGAGSPGPGPTLMAKLPDGLVLLQEPQNWLPQRT